MHYNVRLRRLLEHDDPFWTNLLDEFIKKTYKDYEIGLYDLEELSKDKDKFNEFTKQLLTRKEDLMSLKNEFITSNSTYIFIDNKIYHGKYGLGSIFNEITEFTLCNNIAVIKTKIEFCSDPNIPHLAKVEASYPFIMEQEDIEKLKQLENELFTSRLNKKEEVSISQHYMNVDITINDTVVTISKTDNNLLALLSLIKKNVVSEATQKSYERFIEKE